MKEGRKKKKKRTRRNVKDRPKELNERMRAT